MTPIIVGIPRLSGLPRLQITQYGQTSSCRFPGVNLQEGDEYANCRAVLTTDCSELSHLNLRSPPTLYALCPWNL
jgi:hypothetical protein